MSGIKPIQTFYDGHKFRSRLEARWAVFFHTLGVKYEYEPEGFILPDGTKYLPDFRVKCYGTRGDYTGRHSFDLWVEVKGHMTAYDAKKIILFSGLHTAKDGISILKNPILIVSDIPDEDSRAGTEVDWENGMDGTEVVPYNYELIDGDYFGAFPAAHGRHFYLWGADSSYCNNEDYEMVKNAYRIARQARFEFGEKG